MKFPYNDVMDGTEKHESSELYGKPVARFINLWASPKQEKITAQLANGTPVTVHKRKRSPDNRMFYLVSDLNKPEARGWVWAPWLRSTWAETKGQ